MHGVNLILALREAVTFVEIVVCVHDLAFLLENRFRLLRLLFGVTNVVRSLQDQQTSLCILEILDARCNFIRLAIFQRISQDRLIVLLKRGFFVLLFSKPVRDAKKFD